MAADIAKASLIMAAVDTAAQLIEQALTGDVDQIIKDLETDGVISHTERLAWNRRLKSVGAGVSADVLALHSKLTDRAKALGIDVPVPGTGTEELIARAGSLVSPLSGGR